MFGIARRKTFRMNAAPDGWASRMVALVPLVMAAQNTHKKGRAAQKARSTNLKPMTKKESRMSRKRWPMMAGVLAAGAAVGAAGAMVKRRRKQQRWDEDEAGRAPESVGNDPQPMGSVDSGPLRESTSIVPAMDKRMDAAAATGGKISSPATAVTDGAKPESAA